LIIAGVTILILIVIGLVIAVTSDRFILQERLGRFFESDDKKDSVQPHLPGDSTTDAPPPSENDHKG
jgi:hypothetical protein